MSMVLQVLLVAFAIELKEQRAVRSFGIFSREPASTFVPCEPVDEDVTDRRFRKVDDGMFAVRGNVGVEVRKLFASPTYRWLFAIGISWHIHERLWRGKISRERCKYGTYKN